MDKNIATQKALTLVNKEGLIMTLGTLNAKGLPEIKAIIKFKNDGLRRFIFCSNTSAKRTKDLAKNNRACLYAYEWDPTTHPIVCRGVMLSGYMELSWDDDLRQALWSEALKMYYKSATDPEFVVLEFITESLNYYEGLENISFHL